MSMPIPFHVVNVYAPHGLSGNPIAVITSEVDPGLMQKIARQLNCTGTVFVKQTGPAAYSARMFAPMFEASYGGAGSLGAVWAMGEGRWTQTTSGAVVETEFSEGKGWTEQPEPQISRIDDEDLAIAIGLKDIQAAFLGVAAGAHHLVVVTTDLPPDFQPDAGRLGQIAARHSRCTIGAFCLSGPSEVHGRVFAPAHGVSEDPANAGGAGIVARIMQRHFGMPENLLLREGEEIGRGSRIEVVSTTDRLRVGGLVSMAVEGSIHVD